MLSFYKDFGSRPEPEHVDFKPRRKDWQELFGHLGNPWRGRKLRYTWFRSADLASEHLERRLTAILAADVAGYSRLTGLDEEGTHLQLREHLSSFVNPKIAEYRGRIVKNTGDGLLAEFSSVVDAVRCAIDVQRGMAKRNADVAAEKRIDFRIGINIGDIIIDRGDIFGDGVNVAARLEGVADPGGICMSDDVFRQIQGRVAGDFVDIGEQQLKNIARPVRIFHVRVTGPATDALPLDTSSLPALPPGTELRFPNGARSAETVAYSGKVFAFTNIPIRVPTHFMGRDDALAMIETVSARSVKSRAARDAASKPMAAAFAERIGGLPGDLVDKGASENHQAISGGDSRFFARRKGEPASG
jgi:class 3 adenylate cyclase